mgnify:CR=1 FL=1
MVSTLTKSMVRMAPTMASTKELGTKTLSVELADKPTPVLESTTATGKMGSVTARVSCLTSTRTCTLATGAAARRRARALTHLLQQTKSTLASSSRVKWFPVNGVSVTVIASKATLITISPREPVCGHLKMGTKLRESTSRPRVLTVTNVCFPGRHLATFPHTDMIVKPIS